MKQTRFFLVILIPLVFQINTRGQGFDVVPKVRSLEVGTRYMANSSLDINPVVWTAQADVMGHETRFDLGYEYHPVYSQLYQIAIPLFASVNFSMIPILDSRH